jgi:hypothetical protein
MSLSNKNNSAYKSEATLPTTSTPNASRSSSSSSSSSSTASLALALTRNAQQASSSSVSNSSKRTMTSTASTSTTITTTTTTTTEQEKKQRKPRHQKPNKKASSSSTQTRTHIRVRTPPSPPATTKHNDIAIFGNHYNNNKNNNNKHNRNNSSSSSSSSSINSNTTNQTPTTTNSNTNVFQSFLNSCNKTKRFKVHDIQNCTCNKTKQPLGKYMKQHQQQQHHHHHREKMNDNDNDNKISVQEDFFMVVPDIAVIKSMYIYSNNGNDSDEGVDNGTAIDDNDHDDDDNDANIAAAAAVVVVVEGNAKQESKHDHNQRKKQLLQKESKLQQVIFPSLSSSQQQQQQQQQHDKIKVSCAMCLLDQEPNGFVCIISQYPSNIHDIIQKGYQSMTHKSSLHADHVDYTCCIQMKLVQDLFQCQKSKNKNVKTNDRSTSTSSSSSSRLATSTNIFINHVKNELKTQQNRHNLHRIQQEKILLQESYSNSNITVKLGHHLTSILSLCHNNNNHYNNNNNNNNKQYQRYNDYYIMITITQEQKQQHQNNHHDRMVWEIDIPGGKRHLGESSWDCAKRETEEEVSLCIDDTWLEVGQERKDTTSIDERRSIVYRQNRYYFLQPPIDLLMDSVTKNEFWRNKLE